MIKRFYQNLQKYIQKGKALIIYGPRRVGKTTLLKQFLSLSKEKYRFDTGDNIRLQSTLGSLDFKKIADYVNNFDLIVIDEAQKIPKIGETLKIIADQYPDKAIIATGSSSFELAGQVGEPLTGRKRTLKLFPVAQLELLENSNSYDLKNSLDQYLIYGSYPSILSISDEIGKRRLLNELIDSYLLKDILEFENIKGAKVLLDLLRLLAYQVGSEVSTTELGRQLGIDYKTILRYLDLFEKSFVLFSLRGYSRNLRKEVSKMSKYYFYDNGIRNAVISNFNELNIRNDIGQLWENFIIAERIKKQSYQEFYCNNYFWRTWDKKEIDWIEEREGKLYGYEFKWDGKNEVFAPKDWVNAYDNTEFDVINSDNYLEFIT